MTEALQAETTDEDALIEQRRKRMLEIKAKHEQEQAQAGELLCRIAEDARAGKGFHPQAGRMAFLYVPCRREHCTTAGLETCVSATLLHQLCRPAVCLRHNTSPKRSAAGGSAVKQPCKFFHSRHRCLHTAQPSTFCRHLSAMQHTWTVALHPDCTFHIQLCCRSAAAVAAPTQAAQAQAASEPLSAATPPLLPAASPSGQQVCP